jgi:hypothetical protein
MREGQKAHLSGPKNQTIQLRGVLYSIAHNMLHVQTRLTGVAYQQRRFNRGNTWMW